ncbi:nitrite reductase small subunit NirD [Paenibacillus macquariensis]|uniref:Assimilatory nitrite reductase (NAD(P)H) small subunit n=1 Tax=Paenibacillus macquariensis TaxID=948756 RepID=A0ABY1JKP9_9BACL|nr:nitrite reductase small subunit NirD [Paenibacillus macquariensis]MEC0089985.1 nitrite reductase small subunit NirD [Paenibacillus macquariensis]OAB31130.1 nitrite reductase [Paenibacillus macquariensis subsp. macquariensis]SIQ35562.1 assimilatory nitrite reductase (NAD(P)H) small subunit [Paenibacillus macquariensis]
MEMTTNYYSIGSIDECLVQVGRVVIIEGHEIAIFRTTDGNVYALENKSPHPKGGPLAEAIVSEHYIYDPLYDWKIDLTSGAVQAPDTGQVATYPVIVKNEEIQVGLYA